MATVEVEIPKTWEKTFLTEKKRMSYKTFMKKAEEIEESKWTDIAFDEPVSIEEFSVYLKKQVHG